MILGIDEIASPENQCLIAFREIADLRNYVNDPLAEKFADIFFNERTDQNEIDPVSTHLIKTMSDRSRKLVTDKNTTFYSVLWRYDDVISPIHHKEYLSKLCSDLSSALKQLIDKDVPKTIFDEKMKFSTSAISIGYDVNTCQQTSMVVNRSTLKLSSTYKGQLKRHWSFTALQEKEKRLY